MRRRRCACWRRPPLLMCLACLQRNARSAPFLVLGQAPARPQPVGAAGPAGGRRPAPGGRGLVLRDSPRTARQGATGTIHAPARSVRRACRQRMPGRPTGSPAVPGWRLNGRNLSLLEAAEVIDLYLDIARAQARLRQLGEIPPVLPLHSQLQGYFHEQPGTRDLVSNLAETLGAEHEELNQAKTAEVIAHLERVIANVPPATEFTNTRKYVVLGPLLSIVPFIMTGMWFSQGKPGSASSACCSACSGCSSATSIATQARPLHAPDPYPALGRQPVGSGRAGRRHRFQRQGRHAANHPDPPPAARNAAADPSRRTPGVRLPGHGLQRQDPRITIMSAGLQSDGKKLDCDDMAAILDATSRPPTPSATCNNCAARAE